MTDEDTTMKLPTIAAAIAATLMTSISPASAADLAIEITSIKNSSGTIMIALYDDAETFLSRDGLAARTRMPATAGSLLHVFTGLAPGDYAVSVFHDTDGDGRLKVGAYGQPVEPWGMSRDARGEMGPPRFEDAAITVSTSGATARITLK